MSDSTPEITKLISKAAAKAEKDAPGVSTAETVDSLKWPIQATVGPGLEGAIACETRIGCVNGTNGWLIYQGYNIFDLCAHCTFEEVAYLLLHGDLPARAQLDAFKEKLMSARYVPHTLRMMMATPIEEMNPMSGLRLGTNFMRRRLTWRDYEAGRPDPSSAIASDEDSIPMETIPMGERRAIYEFGRRRMARPPEASSRTTDAVSIDSCIQLIAGVGTITAAIARLHEDCLPIDPDPKLGHAANLLYMMTGEKPSPEAERVMDVALILHADHGMNASTFASMVVASTLSDIYFSIGAAIAALTGPLHGGANEQVIRTIKEIGTPDNVESWYRKAMKKGVKVPGFGHRVYKAYDPRARILEPLAKYLVSNSRSSASSKARVLYRTARELEKQVVATLGKEKRVMPNVDFYSGIVYSSMGIPEYMFTPLFAASRVAGWTARVHEYLKRNRIFRPRAWYVGEFGREVTPISRRRTKKRRK